MTSSWAAAYSNRGDVHAVLQRYEQALADYTEAIQLAPTLAIAYYNRGNLNYELQRYEQALADQNQATQLDPTLPEAYANRGNIYAALEEFDKALSDYNQAIQLDPNYAVGYFNIGAALSNLNRLREALPYFEKATQLGHPQGEQHIILVEQLLGLEVFEEAGSIDELRHAMAEFPFMLNMAYVEAIKQAIIQYIPQEQQPIFDQRLAWLRQITTGTSE